MGIVFPFVAAGRLLETGGAFSLEKVGVNFLEPGKRIWVGGMDLVGEMDFLIGGVVALGPKILLHVIHRVIAFTQSIEMGYHRAGCGGYLQELWGYEERAGVFSRRQENGAFFDDLGAYDAAGRALIVDRWSVGAG